MNSNYVAEIQPTSIPDEQLVYPATFIPRHICIRIQVARPTTLYPGVNVALQ